MADLLPGAGCSPVLCSSDTCPLYESAVQVSQLASEFSHSMFQQRYSRFYGKVKILEK